MNALIRNVILQVSQISSFPAYGVNFALQERSGVHSFDHEGLTLQYKLDNEFDLVFVVAYQKILQLSYVDKFLSDIHLEFRDKYKNDLANSSYFQEFEFVDNFNATLQAAEQWAKAQAKAPKNMRTFEQSNKSKKTVASMIERKGEEKKQPKKKEVVFSEETNAKAPPSPQANHVVEEDIMKVNRAKFAEKMNKKKGEPKYNDVLNVVCGVSKFFLGKAQKLLMKKLVKNPEYGI